MSSKLNVLYVFNDGYAQCAGVSIYSLYENNKDIEELAVYCVITDVKEKNIMRLRETAAQFGREIVFLDGKEYMKKIEKVGGNSWNGSLIIWLKIFILEEFIGKIEQILFIDADTLVVNSLAELCDFDFEGKTIAWSVDSISFDDLHRLKIENNMYYYNSGVMLINLKYFAEQDRAFESLFSHLRKNVNRYLVCEQDWMNDCLGNNTKLLSNKYNFQGIHCLYSDKVYYKVYGKYRYYTKEELINARENVCILHFFRVFGDYPWEEGNHHPLRNEYETWKARTLWSDEPMLKKKRKMLYKVEYILYRLMPQGFFLRLFKWITQVQKTK